MSREEHNKMARVENLIWEIAKILQEKSYIEKDKIEKAKKALLTIFQS
jgi:hypothetical protein